MKSWQYVLLVIMMLTSTVYAKVSSEAKKVSWNEVENISKFRGNGVAGKEINEFHIILGMEQNILSESFMKIQAIQLKSFFDDENVIYSDLHIMNHGEITFELLDPQDLAKVKKMLKNVWKVIPGVSFANDGLKFSFKISNEGMIGIKNKTIPDTIKSIQNRLTKFGLAGYTVAKQGAERITVDVPGLHTEEEKERIYEFVTRQGLLQLMVIDERDAFKTGPLGTDEAKRYGDIILPDINTKKKYLLHNIPIVFSSSLLNAKVSFDTNNNPVVDFVLNKRDTKRLADFSGKGIGKRIAIVVDDKVYTTLKIKKR